MSKKVNLALLTLAAFLVLGFSLTVNAEKPKPDKLQTLTSAPLWGDELYCNALNMTAQDIDLHAEIILSDGVTKIVDVNETVSPKVVFTRGYISNTAGYCVVSWWGQKSDFRASFCGVTINDNSLTYATSWDCIEVFQ